MKLVIALLSCFALTGCSYRYDLGRFEANSVPKPDPEPAHEKPCEDPVQVQTTSLQVTTKLDEANQTVTTNAVSETHKTQQEPCN
jgi:hypothetical protein